jgi:large conductance mechanosensitive channel
MKKLFEEFKSFAVRGNVMNLAVGVIIGAAFQGVVTSFTDNIISPIIGVFTGRNFDSLSVTFLGVSLRYGAFITSVIDFIIMALVVFLIVKAVNRLLTKKDDSPAAPVTKTCPYCKTAVDDAATRCPACTSELTD